MLAVPARPLPIGTALARRLGPRYRWAILTICALGVFQVTFHAYAYATLLPTLMRDLDLDNSQAGSLLSAYFITYGLVQVPIGYVADRFGSRRVMLASLLLFSIGVFLIPFSTSYGTGLATRLLAGLGASAIYVPGLRLVPNWFPQRRIGLIYGLISSGSSIGSSVALVLIPWLTGIFGWRNGYLFAAASVPLMCGLAWCLLARQPADVGLRVEPAVTPPAIGPPVPFLPALRRVLGNRLIWPYGWGTAIYYGGFAGILAWTPTFLIQDIGYSRETAGLITALFPLANILSSPFAGFVADRTGRRKLVFLSGIAATGASAVAFALIAPRVGLPVHLAMMIVFSLSTSATVLPFSIATNLVEPPVFGTAVGLMNAYYFIGAVFYPVLLGRVVDLTGVRANAFFAIGILTVIGIVVVARGQERSQPASAAVPVSSVTVRQD